MRTQVLETHPHPKYPRLSVQLRSNSRFYQAVTYLDGKLVQKSTKATHLPTALKLGEDWYRKLLRASVTESKRHPLDRIAVDPTVAEVFAAYRLTLTKAKRAYADMKWSTIADFWRTVVVTDVGPKTFREFYRWRRRHKTQQGTTVKNHSIHKDIIVIRQVLKHAIEEEHLTTLPLIPSPGPIAANPRPWLTAAEWRTLVAVAEKRFNEAADANQTKVAAQRIEMLDLMQFMVLSMCRVQEVLTLRFGDCRVEGEDKILVAHVTGKRGSRTIVAPRDAAKIIEHRATHAEPSDLVFPNHHRDAFRELLKAAGLYEDAAGFTRNMKSLRATAISFRLLEPNPNLLAIARNAGTSLQMIDQFYATFATSTPRAHTSASAKVSVRIIDSSLSRRAGRNARNLSSFLATLKFSASITNRDRRSSSVMGRGGWTIEADSGA